MMHSRLLSRSRLALALVVALAGSSCRSFVGAQEVSALSGPEVSLTPDDPRAGIRRAPTERVVPRFRTRRDSVEWATSRALADKSSGFRVIVSSYDRTLWVVAGRDTVFTAPVAVAAEGTLTYAGRTWEFRTPRGQRTVLKKEKDPVWIPPDWHYAETARDHGLKLGRLPMTGTVSISRGRKLQVRNGEVGVILPGQPWQALPVDEQIVFDDTLFMPPIGTKNRRIEGELGKYRLDMGNGYLLHGTPYKDSIGRAVTHGCVRLDDEDIEWLYTNIPVGTKVYIY